jgi:hypothetical protein
MVCCLAGGALGSAEPPLRTGTIILGVPRAQFVVLGADRLWTNALAKPGDLPWDRRGRQVKIARHASLPLAIAAAGLGTLGPQQDTMAYIGELIARASASTPSSSGYVPRFTRRFERCASPLAARWRPIHPMPRPGRA